MIGQKSFIQIVDILFVSMSWDKRFNSFWLENNKNKNFVQNYIWDERNAKYLKVCKWGTIKTWNLQAYLNTCVIFLGTYIWSLQYVLFVL